MNGRYTWVVCMAALGGRENAFTSRDNTGYYQQIPAGKLEDVMRLERGQREAAPGAHQCMR